MFAYSSLLNFKWPCIFLRAVLNLQQENLWIKLKEGLQS